MAKNIYIIDYGMGNIRSVFKAFEFVNREKGFNFNIKVAQNPKEIKDPTLLVIPGVGAFKDAVKNLKRKGLWEKIVKEKEKGHFIFGICLGFHLLFERSYEFGLEKGFGFIKGRIVKFKLPKAYKIPHMGWNQILKLDKNIKAQVFNIYKNIDSGEYVYFVHSYYPKNVEHKAILTLTDYYITFVSSVQKDNVFGTQFHPEKSQKVGLKILENVLRGILYVF